MPTISPDSRPRRLISASALRHNFELLRLHAGAAPELWPALKADAYGHGVAVVLAVVRAFEAPLRPGGICLARVSEAIEVRNLGWDGRLLVMGPAPGAVAPEAVATGIELCVCAPCHVDAAAAAARAANTRGGVHLKIDTGMRRIGCAPEDVPALLERIRATGCLEVKGLMSHLARADEPGNPHAEALTQRQHAVFSEAIDLARAWWRDHATALAFPPIHLANSAAILLETPAARFDIVRPGLAIYGLLPFNHAPATGLRPVMELRAPVVAAGTHHWKVGIGAADGFSPRHGGRASALLHPEGWPLPIVQVDACTSVVELPGGAHHVPVPAEVMVVGIAGARCQTAEQLAAVAGTINYEVTTGLAPDLPTSLLE